MKAIQNSTLRAQVAALNFVRDAKSRRERGDVPGWVLITLMTAALVAVIWAVARPQFQLLFERAISKVSKI